MHIESPNPADHGPGDGHTVQPLSLARMALMACGLGTLFVALLMAGHLPRVLALTDATISARSEGYLLKRLEDMGDHVTRGQLLAEIESPELDQHVRQGDARVAQSKHALVEAEAGLERARVACRLAEVTAKRYKSLVDVGLLPRQDGDEKAADATPSAPICAFRRRPSRPPSPVSPSRKRHWSN